jgi:hypothetical protein
MHRVVAQFEIWNTDSDIPQRLEDHRLSLDRHEVESQVKNFLICIRLAEKKRAFQANSRLRAGQSRLQWVLPFPTTISSNLKMIVVLRTVYILSPSLTTQLPVDSPSTDTFRSVMVPIEYTEPCAPAQEDLRKRRKTMKQEAENDSVGLHLSHSYKFEISKNGQYILYSGTTGLNLPQYSNSEPLVTSLAVFLLNTSEDSCLAISGTTVSRRPSRLVVFIQICPLC